MKGQYLSTEHIQKVRRKSRSRRWVGGILGGFFLLSVVLSITDDELREYFFTYLLCFLPFGIMWYRGYSEKQWIEKANRYNTIFECDNDGYVSISELERQTGKNAAAIVADLDTLLNKGYLCKCTLQKQGQLCVILSAGRVNKSGFTHVECASCGATGRIRIGSSGKCEYCGSSLYVQ